MSRWRGIWVAGVVGLVSIAVALLLGGCSSLLNPAQGPLSGEAVMEPMKKGCTTIQEGILTYSSGHYLAGQPLTVGYDPYGDNYQAHMFNGSFANVYLGRDGFPPYEGDDEAYYQRLVDEGYFGTVDEAMVSMAKLWYWPYRDVQLVMKWNDAWLSNKDCDGDGKLDRHYGYLTYIGSGAWETNHQYGEYLDEEGNTCKWEYFVKIVAVPEDATLKDAIWYAADGTEIGPAIWGSFAIIQEVSNDPCAGEHGILYLSPAGPGFGKWGP